MNLFYEDYPNTITVGGRDISIVTDFREYVKLIDMLKDDSLSSTEKMCFLSQYFLEVPDDFSEAMEKLTDFIIMESKDNAVRDEAEPREIEEAENKKEVYSFDYDYPFIFSAFLSEYGINLRTIKYMHWWEFKLLFDGLSEKTEIKQRILYRSIDLNTIKDKNERERIKKIQNSIRLPQDRLSDYDIGDAFGW